MNRHHAVVIGGSVAGLMAAQVLSRHFGAVTVLDRDGLTDDLQPNHTLPRKSVPQGQHVHVLLNSGLQALALDRLLAVRPGSAVAEPVQRGYFRACKALIEVPWLITQAEALRFEATPGQRSLKIRCLQAYTGQVFALSAEHVGVYRAFLDVMHLMAGPSALFRPAVLGRVLQRVLGRVLMGLVSGVLALFKALSPGAPPAPSSPSGPVPDHAAVSGKSAARPATAPTARPDS